MLQNLCETEHPGRELDVDEGDLGAEEERTLGVAVFDDLGDFVLEFLGLFGLFAEFLGLENAVE